MSVTSIDDNCFADQVRYQRRSVCIYVYVSQVAPRWIHRWEELKLSARRGDYSRDN